MVIIYKSIFINTSNLNTQLTSNALTTNKYTNTSGGYCKIGNLVIVNLRISNTSEQTNRTVTGFPQYRGQNRVSVNAYDYVSDDVNSASIDQNGKPLVSNTSANGSIISGCYICD